MPWTRLRPAEATITDHTSSSALPSQTPLHPSTYRAVPRHYAIFVNYADMQWTGDFEGAGATRPLTPTVDRPLVDTRQLTDRRGSQACGCREVTPARALRALW